MSLLRYKNDMVFDTETDLMWQDELAPQRMSWDDAKEYAKNLRLGGFDDWSLPDSKALKNLYLNKAKVKALRHLDKSKEYNRFPFYYWTKTTSMVNDTPTASMVSFENGTTNGLAKGGNLFVRCIRKPKVSKLSIDFFLSQEARFKINGDKIILPDFSYTIIKIPIFRDFFKNLGTTQFMFFYRIYRFCVLLLDEVMAKFKINGEKIILYSSINNTTDLFLVTKSNKEYFGTKNEILRELELELEVEYREEISYSQNPFEEIQKRVQEKLNTYRDLPIPKKPDIPKQRQLIKDEFETTSEFQARVALAVQEQETAIKLLNEKYNQDLESRKVELAKRALNLQGFKTRQLHETFVSVFGTPVLSDAQFDVETNTMFVMLNGKKR